MKRTLDAIQGTVPQSPRPLATIHRGEPVPGHDNRPFHEVLNDCIAQTPAQYAAVDVMRALDRGKHVPNSADSGTCQEAAELLLQYGQATLLGDLIQQRPDHTMLSVGDSSVAAGVLQRAAPRWPQEATAYVVLSASQPFEPLAGLHGFLQQPCVLHMHLTVDSDCDPDAVQALCHALKQRPAGIGTFILSAHPACTPALRALHGVKAQAFTLRIAPLSAPQDRPFCEALAALLQASEATVLDVSDPGIGPELGARLVNTCKFWDSVTATGNLSFFQSANGLIDHLALCGMQGVWQPSPLEKGMLEEMGVQVVEIDTAVDLHDLRKWGSTVSRRLEACFVVPHDTNLNTLWKELTHQQTHAIELRHRPMALAFGGYEHISDSFAHALNTLHTNTSSTLHTSPTFRLNRELLAGTVSKLREIVRSRRVKDLVSFLRKPENAWISPVDPRHLDLNWASKDIREFVKCLSQCRIDGTRLLHDTITGLPRDYIEEEQLDGVPFLAEGRVLELCRSLIDFPLLQISTFTDWDKVAEPFLMRWPIAGIPSPNGGQWPNLPIHDALPVWTSPVLPSLIVVNASENVDPVDWEAWVQELKENPTHGLCLRPAPGHGFPVERVVQFLTLVREARISIPHLALEGIIVDTLVMGARLTEALCSTITAARISSLTCRTCMEDVVFPLLKHQHWKTLNIENSRTTAALFQRGAVSAHTLQVENELPEDSRDADFYLSQRWIQAIAGHCRELQSFTVTGSEFNFRYLARAVALNPSIRHFAGNLSATSGDAQVGDAINATDELKSLRLLRRNTTLQQVDHVPGEWEFAATKEYAVSDRTITHLSNQLAYNRWINPAHTARSTAYGLGLSKGAADALALAGASMDPNDVQRMSEVNKNTFFGSRHNWALKVRELANLLNPRTPVQNLLHYLASLTAAGILQAPKDTLPMWGSNDLLINKVKTLYNAGLPPMAIGQALRTRLADGMPPPTAALEPSQTTPFEIQDIFDHLQALAYIGVMPAREWLNAAHDIWLPDQTRLVPWALEDDLLEDSDASWDSDNEAYTPYVTGF